MGLRNRSRSNSPKSEVMSVSVPKSSSRCTKTLCVTGVVLLVITLAFFLTNHTTFRKSVEEPFVPSVVDQPLRPHITRFHHDTVSQEQYYKDMCDLKRFSTVITTDKGLYRPGDTVFVRVNLFDALDFKPLVNTSSRLQNTRLSVQLVTPTGSKDGKGRLRYDSSGGFGLYHGSFKLDGNAAGGDYTVQVLGEKQVEVLVAPAQRNIQVQVSSKANPKLSMALTFEKDGYAVGDTVVALLSGVKRLSTGEPAFMATVSAKASVSGTVIFSSSSFTVDPSGECTITFPLSGVDTVDPFASNVITIVVADGGDLQSISKTIPVVTKNVLVEFYPESGDLVVSEDQNILNRIYIQVKHPATNEPMKIKGSVVDLTSDLKVASIETTHEGRGVTSPFVVERNHQYALRITSPNLEVDVYPIPGNTESTGLITLPQGKAVFASGEPITVTVNGHPGTRRVVISKRDKMLDTKTIQIKGSAQSVEFHVPPEGSGDGVLRVTLYDDVLPIAERLLFRAPESFLRVDCKVLNMASPGGSVEVELSTVQVDKQGEKPVSAMVGVTVTDDARQLLLEERKRAPGLSVAAYVESEVSELLDPESYLGDPVKMDLLLGIQGWRRFAYKNMTTFLSHKDMELKKLSMFAIDNKYQEMGRPVMMAMAMRKANFRGAQPEVDLLVLDDFAGMDEMEAAAPLEVLEVDNIAIDQIGFDNPVSHHRIVAYERVFAFKANVDKKVRDNFQETIYWNPGIQTSLNKATGQYTARIQFDTSDSITTFGIYSDAISNSAVGQGKGELISRKAVSIDVDLPSKLQSGDEVWMPVVVSSEGGSAAVSVESTGLRVSPVTSRDGVVVTSSEDKVMMTLSSTTSTRVYIPLVANTVGQAQVTAAIESDKNNLRSTNGDMLTRGVEVALGGFPVEGGGGGFLKRNTVSGVGFVVPEDTIGDVNVNISVHLSPAGQLLSVVESLLRTPCGCFEQTSSTTYPMVIGLQYLIRLQSTSTQVKGLIDKARRLLEVGYTRLASYETPTGGFSWFGDAPGHEALTAYGVLQFSAMAKPEMGLADLVDNEMLERTSKWLLDRRNGDGNFLQSSRALDTFGRAPQTTTNAYILWSLAKAGLVPWDTLKVELAHMMSTAKNATDPYVLALASCILFDYKNDADKTLALDFAKRLESMQNSTSGCIQQQLSFDTITMSMGTARTIEATSLTILAWIRRAAVESNSDATKMQRALDCISSLSQGGRYMSTQSTALALEAIVEYLRLQDARVPKQGTVQISLEEDPSFNVELPFSSDNFTPTLSHAFSLSSSDVKQYTLKLQVQAEGSEKLNIPFIVNTKLNAQTPESANCVVGIATTLPSTAVEGDIVEVGVRVENKNATAAVPMTLAQVGIPSGAEVRLDKLVELKSAKTFAFFEVQPSYVTFYWLGLNAGEVVEFSIELLAKIPGRYQAPASRVYLYYEDEKKMFIEGNKFEITPKDPSALLLSD